MNVRHNTQGHPRPSGGESGGAGRSYRLELSGDQESRAEPGPDHTRFRRRGFGRFGVRISSGEESIPLGEFHLRKRVELDTTQRQQAQATGLSIQRVHYLEKYNEGSMIRLVEKFLRGIGYAIVIVPIEEAEQYLRLTTEQE